MRINKMITCCFALIFYQILSTHSLRKYIKISLENLYVDIMGLKGLSVGLHPIGHRVQWYLATLSPGFFSLIKLDAPSL